MKNFLRFILLGLVMLAGTLQTAARGNGDDVVYVFAVGTSLNDSVYYLSAVQRMDGATLEKGTKFLANRSAYSRQFRAYLKRTYAADHTCTVFYTKQRSAAEKKYLKLRKLYNGKKDCRLVEVAASDFALSLPDSEE